MTEKEKWIKINICRYCRGSRLHSCTGHNCQEAEERAGEAFDRIVKEGFKAAVDKRDMKIRNLAAGRNDGNAKEISRSPPR